ncbi:MAG: hypothetical protein NTW10_08740 [Bacteroidetes bacterium]|nr:hypothetical protein [Bacteroidota bacterium]
MKEFTMQECRNGKTMSRYATYIPTPTHPASSIQEFYSFLSTITKLYRRKP